MSLSARTGPARAPGGGGHGASDPRRSRFDAGAAAREPELAAVPARAGARAVGLRLLSVRHEALHDRVEVKGLCRLASRSWPVKLRAAGTRERAGWRKRP